MQSPWAQGPGSRHTTELGQQAAKVREGGVKNDDDHASLPDIFKKKTGNSTGEAQVKPGTPEQKAGGEKERPQPDPGPKPKKG